MVKKQDLKIARDFKVKLSKVVPIEKMYLFGSRVKGKTHKFSDYDIVIVSRKFKGIASRYRSLGFYKYWDSDAPFDFLCYTPEEFKKLSKESSFISEIVREGMEI